MFIIPLLFPQVRIKMTSDEVKDQKLYLHVCDFNQISPRDLIGSYHVNLQNTKIKNKDTKYSGSLEWIESVSRAIAVLCVGENICTVTYQAQNAVWKV